MRKLVMFITIFMSVILSQFIFVNNVKAVSVTGASGRVYTNLQNDRAVIYATNGYTLASTTPYNNFRVLYTPYNVLCSYNNSNFIYAYDNISQCSEFGVNKRMTRYSVANSSYSSYNDSATVLYFTIGSYPFNNDYSVAYNYIDYSYLDIVDNNGNIIYCGNVETNCSTLPSYLTGYKKVTLNIDEVNLILSGLSSGSVFIPYDSFMEYGGRLSYFVKDVPYQAWDTVIDDYHIMDSEFVRQDFDISNYSNASYVMFSKYLYLEGEDDIVYDIYIPDDMYSSLLTATLNNNGGYDYTYEVIDENNNIQEESFTSLDYGISPTSPLLSDLFSNFASSTFGLTAIVTAPLNLISSITSSSCFSLNIPLPYINSTLTLPCMTTIYQNHFGAFFSVYQTITFGVISYWVIVRIFNLVKDFKNPEHDEIEVLDL